MTAVSQTQPFLLCSLFRRILQSQHPEEAQVAAAALVACGNDPAAAIVALMEAAERVQNA